MKYPSVPQLSLPGWQHTGVWYARHVLQMKELRMGARQGPEVRRARFQFSQHPWISLGVSTITSVFVLLLFAVMFRMIGFPDNSPVVDSLRMTLTHVVTLFVITPFVLRLPKGKRSFGEYLRDIGLSWVQPLGRFLLLGFSCYLILALSQAAGSVVYRLSQGLTMTGAFIRRVFDLSGDLPPRSHSLLVSFPSVFEEVGS
jgi:hypothetical protein